MSKIESLLAATDFSDDGRNAVERAAMLAAEQQAGLMLLHVMSGAGLATLRDVLGMTVEAEARLVAEAESMLIKIASDVAEKTGLVPASQVSVGHVQDEILSLSHKADMLVLGARGMNPVRDAILGTTAERLLRKCAKPILIAKRPPQETYRRVLVPVDFSPYSAGALQMAARIAPRANIRIVHAFEVPMEGKLWLADVSEDKIQEFRIQAKRQALDNIGSLIKEANVEALSCTRVVEYGATVPLILATEMAYDADLIVVGKHSSLVEEIVLGSVTRHILSDAKCDVLVVHQKL